jgi:type II secretory pathway pseudopilin PulG
MDRQRGASGIFVAIILVILAVGIIAVLSFSGSSAKVDRGRQVVASMTAVQSALKVFVTGNKRLPCPADPAMTDGLESAGGGGACNSPRGVIPWATLGLRSDDVVDPWGQILSYRVFAGSIGLTRPNGASMVDCTTDPGAATFAPGGSCNSVHGTRADAFLNNKGLRINNFGALVDKVAYVIVSHGMTGRGGYNSGGKQNTPLPQSPDELSNLDSLATTIYVAKISSNDSVGPDDLNHFDDVVMYAKIGELIQSAGLGARAWEVPFASTRLDAGTIQEAMHSPSPPTTGDLNTKTIDFGSATVTGGNASGDADITFSSAGGGGIGVTSGQLQSGQNEFLTIVLDRSAGWFAFAAFNFNVLSGRTEQVKLTFSLDGTTTGSTTLQACKPNTFSVPSSFSVNVASLTGSQFDTVEVRPVTATPSGNTALFLSEFDTCSSGAPNCLSGLAQADSTTICP